MEQRSGAGNKKLTGSATLLDTKTIKREEQVFARFGRNIAWLNTIYPPGNVSHDCIRDFG